MAFFDERIVVHCLTRSVNEGKYNEMVCLAFSVLLCKTGRFSAVLGYTVR